jgi:colicin import membrane protein
MKIWAGVLTGLLAWGAGATVAPDPQTQDPATRRRAIEAAYEREQADCRQRFAVHACTAEANARRHQALQALHLLRRSVDAERRLQRADQRQAGIDRRQQARLDRSLVPPAAPPAPMGGSAAATVAVPGGVASPAVLATQQVAKQATRSASRDAASAQAKAAARAAGAQRLQGEIQADQARIRDRQARRSARGKESAPLPAPAVGTSAPA